ncbi:MAG TPA: hypothetical protein VFP31_06265 [Gaiellaceae bacterium]|nr:hypothetical protein [Gaiellaceae bacterium]
MATVLELAAHADLPVETVLRVLLREPTNEAAARRVAEAVAELGLPDYPRPDGHVEVVAMEEEPPDLVVHERRPVPTADGQELAAELRDVFQDLLRRLDRERRERIDDVALTTDLITEGWRTVDRRLGRLEKIIERLDRYEYFEGGTKSDSKAEVHRLDDVRRPGA